MVLQRIEAALARLEAAAQQPGRTPPMGSAPDAASELASLAASNTRLRDAVRTSLRQIDAMIARHDTDGEP